MGDEWPRVAFADAPVEIIDGDRGKNYPKQADFLESGHCLFLNTGNVTIDGFDFSRCQFIAREKDKALRKGKIKRHDLVMTTRGTVGNVAYYNDRVPFDHIRINSGMVIFRPDPQQVEPLYLYQFLRSSVFKSQVAALRTGSAQPQLPIRDINRIELSIPPLSEQRAIAHILGTLDDKIELNRRLNETLEATARAIFKSWFVDFDPVRAKAAGEQPPGLAPHIADLFPDAFVASELGEIPKGWQVGTLGMIANEVRDTVQATEIEPGTPYIALQHMPRRCIALNSWDMASDIASAKLRFKTGDILFGKLRPYFHKVGPAPLDGVCSTDIVVCRPQDDLWYGFALGHVSSDAFVAYTNSGSTGTKMPRTNWRYMSAFKIALPPSEVAAQFSEIVHPLLSRIRYSIFELNTLAALRDTLLPRLISGELRVPDAERFVERCA
jgi:type I restriction enzyme S subunit